MTQNICALDLSQVGWDIFGNFCPHLGVELFEERMINLFACGKKTLLELLIPRQHVQALGQLANKSLAGFQFDIMTLAVGHRARTFEAAASRESSRQIRNLLHEPSVSFCIVKLLEKLKAGRTIDVIVVFQFECFETSEVSNYKQCILHNLPISNCRGVTVLFAARHPTHNLTHIRTMGIVNPKLPLFREAPEGWDEANLRAIQQRFSH
jgi:hypothetical protein